jgi:maltose alpha-D-glucosyltransferase/alpha-amylase
MKFRIRRDYHLGQTPNVHTDVLIVDFDGEPSLSVAERRAKDAPLRDVAGMLRSISYA